MVQVDLTNMFDIIKDNQTSLHQKPVTDKERKEYKAKQNHILEALKHLIEVDADDCTETAKPVVNMNQCGTVTTPIAESNDHFFIYHSDDEKYNEYVKDVSEVLKSELENWGKYDMSKMATAIILMIPTLVYNEKITKDTSYNTICTEIAMLHNSAGGSQWKLMNVSSSLKTFAKTADFKNSKTLSILSKLETVEVKIMLEQIISFCEEALK